MIRFLGLIFRWGALPSETLPWGVSRVNSMCGVTDENEMCGRDRENTFQRRREATQS